MEKNTKKEYEKARELRNLATHFRNMLNSIHEKDKQADELITAYNAVIEHAAAMMEFFGEGH